MAEAEPEEAKHHRQGYAEWVERILNQKEGYRMAHNWTRGTPKAPPLPTAATIEGHPYGHPSVRAQIPQGLGGPMGPRGQGINAGHVSNDTKH
eukprot:5530506-Karenia_brevis.AAC.1